MSDWFRSGMCLAPNTKRWWSITLVRLQSFIRSSMTSNWTPTHTRYSPKPISMFGRMSVPASATPSPGPKRPMLSSSILTNASTDAQRPNFRTAMAWLNPLAIWAEEATGCYRWRD